MIALAKEFATYAHNSINQTRKYTGEPYIVHPTAVANLVSLVSNDKEIIASAWLHDVVEDTHYSLEDIETVFNSKVADIVCDLTKVTKKSEGSREYRKAMEREHIQKASIFAKTIKLADIIDNTKSIEIENPEFAKIYMAEKRLMLEVLKDGNPFLYNKANQIIENYYKSL
jgi:(p)ppGpp synthase/HD superfamily hydrolase